MTSVQEQLRAFLLRYLPVDEVAHDQDLFETGVVDSLFLIQLVTFAEKEFAIKVRMEDMDRANFRTLDVAAAFIARQPRRDCNR